MTRIPEAPHTTRHNFPFVGKDGRWIATDEQCYCKHLRSAHVDTLAYGHGACIRCECEKFTWKRFVLKPEPPEQSVEEES